MIYTFTISSPYGFGRTEAIEVTAPENGIAICWHSTAEPRVIWISMAWDGSVTQSITYRMKNSGAWGNSETVNITPQGNNISGTTTIQGMWSTVGDATVSGNCPILYTEENPSNTLWSRIATLAREYFDTPHAKLVIKGKDGNVEFKAVETAEFPRIAFSEGSYYPLVEDDESEGATLKVRIGDKVYRLKKDKQWEAYFDVNFTDLSSYITQLMVIIDDSYNVLLYDPANSKPLFTSTYLKRVGNERKLYAATNEYAHGPWNAEYSIAQTPYAEISNGNGVGNGSGYYTQMVISTSLSSPTLPFAEVCFAWMYGTTQTYSQACIFNPNKRKNYPWQSYQTYGCCGEYINTLFGYNTSHTFNLKNTVLFAGKVRIIKLNNSGSTSITDLNAKIPISERLSTSHVAFAIPDKNVNMPFELVFADPYLANATMQGATFDLYGPVNAPTKVGSDAKTEFEGSYSDIIADHSGQFNNVVTAKKACTIVAMNRRGESSTAQAIEYVCAKDDTFNIDMASQYYRSYPWVYFAYQNIDDTPTEIAFYRQQSGSDVFGYIYNTRTKQVDINTGTYFSKNGVGISKSTNFSGDLLVQPMSGVVQILDGGDSWSENYFSGFAMVFLATDSTIMVNTTAGDDVMIFDKNGSLLDEQTADNSGNVTFTVPTTKLGRQYHIQSAITGASADVVASGNMSVRMVMPEDAVQIYKDSQFSNVIDGFDISNYKLVLDGSSEYTYANAIPYLNTNWGINNKAGNNSGDFTIDGNYIIKSQQSTSSVSGTYYIPIKKVSGYNKLRCSVKMRNTGSSNAIEIGAYLSKPSDTSFPFEIVGRYQNLSYTDQNDVELCALLDSTKDVDYIRLMGDVGTPAYNDIKLIKDYVHKSETPINVIFRDGQWGPGVTTDFDFTGKDFIYTGGEVSDYMKTICLSRYNLRLYGQLQANYPFVVSGNVILKSDSGVYGQNYNLSNIYIPIKRAYGYTKCKVKMGQLSLGSSSYMNYVACDLFYINSSRNFVGGAGSTIRNTIGINEYEIDISQLGYVDYIGLGCTEGDCVWQSITLE